MTAQDQNSYLPQEIPTQPVPPEAKPSSIGKPVLIFILGLLIFGAGCAVAYFFINKTTAQVNVVKPIAKISTISTPTPALLSNLPKHKLLYVKNQNIYLMDTQANTEKQLTSDASDLITYRLPLWIDVNSLSFERCQHVDKNDSQPYTCSVHTLDLDNNITQTIISNQSKPNINNYQTGGFIQVVGWSHDKNQLAFLLEDYTLQAKDFGVTELHVFNISNKTDNILFSHLNSGGRGGSLDDDVSLHFSPDDTKLLLNYTSLYPGVNNAIDNGTLLVFDVGQKSLLWKMPQTWSAFGQWQDNTSFLAKQSPVASGSMQLGDSSLVAVDLAANKTKTILAAKSWYQLEADGNNNIFFWMVNANQGKGVILQKVDLGSKVVMKIRENVIKVKVLSDGLVIVRTMIACHSGASPEKLPECGMDIFNGYTENGLGILDPRTGDVITLNISSTSPFDVTDVDGI